MFSCVSCFGFGMATDVLTGRCGAGSTQKEVTPVGRFSA